jgi:hypothetical protein
VVRSAPRRARHLAIRLLSSDHRAVAPDGTLEVTGKDAGRLLPASCASVGPDDPAGTGFYVKGRAED